MYESGERKWRPKEWWVMPDKAAGEGYDWLRKNASEAGALSAKIRAEFTMHNALSVAFLAITVMACFAEEYWWAVASGLATPLMAYRGATTEKTFQSTTRKLYKAAEKEKNDLSPAPRLIWLMPEDKGDGGYPLWEDGKGCVEFRNRTWMTPDNQDETLGFLTGHHLPYMCVDMLQGHRDSIPPVLAATSPGLAVVRMHGHSDKWDSKDIHERFGYRYTGKELDEWASNISNLAARAELTHVLFNNCYRDYAQVNAQQLTERLNES